MYGENRKRAQWIMEAEEKLRTNPPDPADNRRNRVWMNLWAPNRKPLKPRAFYPCIRCHAHKKDGSPCKNFAIHGGTVCMAHGGAARQVRAKAWERVELACARARAEGLLSDIHIEAAQHAADIRELLGLDRRSQRLAAKAEKRAKAKFLADQAKLDALEGDREELEKIADELDLPLKDGRSA